MSHSLVVMVVNRPEQVPEILDAWEAAGVHGVTILESTGMGQVKELGLLENLPLLPTLRDLLEAGEVHHRTLLSVADSEALVERMIAAVERISGDLDEPHTGFLFVVPVLRVIGIGRPRSQG